MKEERRKIFVAIVVSFWHMAREDCWWWWLCLVILYGDMNHVPERHKHQFPPSSFSLSHTSVYISLWMWLTYTVLTLTLTFSYPPFIQTWFSHYHKCRHAVVSVFFTRHTHYSKFFHNIFLTLVIRTYTLIHDTIDVVDLQYLNHIPYTTYYPSPPTTSKVYGQSVLNSPRYVFDFFFCSFLNFYTSNMESNERRELSCRVKLENEILEAILQSIEMILALKVYFCFLSFLLVRLLVLFLLILIFWLRLIG